MADYYSVLKKTVAALPESSGATRRAVYSRARTAIVNQLKAYEPPLSPSEITNEQLQLEEAIRKVEAEASRQSLMRPAPSPRPSSPEPAAPPPAEKKHAPAPPPSLEPAVKAPVSTEEAEQKPSPMPAAPMPAAPVYTEAKPVKPADSGEVRPTFSERAAASPSPRAMTPENKAPAGVQAFESAASSYSQESSEVDRLEAAVVSARQSGGGAAKEGVAPSAPSVDRSRSATPYEENGKTRGWRRDDEANLARRGRKNNGVAAAVKTGASASAPYNDAPLKPSRLPMIVTLIVIFLIVTGLGAIGYSQRTTLADLFSGGEENPALIPEAPTAATAEKEQEGEGAEKAVSVKNAARLLTDDGEPVSPDARSVTTMRISRNGEDGAGETQAPAPQEDANEDQPVAAEDAAGPDEAAVTSDPVEDGSLDQSSSSAQSATTSIEEQSAAEDGIAVAQRAILYEEGPEASSAGTASSGQTVWSVAEEETNGETQTVLKIKADIPSRDLNANISLKPNLDPSLPASHLLEIEFVTPEGFSGGAISNVPGLVMKTTEEARGEGLAGASVKVADGYFWVALSNVPSELERNLVLLRERGWIDIPMLYADGKRAILTIEKGTPGANAVEKALAAWEQG